MSTDYKVTRMIREDLTLTLWLSQNSVSSKFEEPGGTYVSLNIFKAMEKAEFNSKHFTNSSPSNNFTKSFYILFANKQSEKNIH